MDGPSLIALDVLQPQVDGLGMALNVVLVLSLEAALLALVQHLVNLVHFSNIINVNFVNLVHFCNTVDEDDFSDESM